MYLHLFTYLYFWININDKDLVCRFSFLPFLVFAYELVVFERQIRSFHSYLDLLRISDAKFLIHILSKISTYFFSALDFDWYFILLFFSCNSLVHLDFHIFLTRDFCNSERKKEVFVRFLLIFILNFVSNLGFQKVRVLCLKRRHLNDDRWERNWWKLHSIIPSFLWNLTTVIAVYITHPNLPHKKKPQSPVICT